MDTVTEHRIRTLVDAGVRRVHRLVGDGGNPVAEAIALSASGTHAPTCDSARSGPTVASPPAHVPPWARFESHPGGAWRRAWLYPTLRLTAKRMWTHGANIALLR
ncbi:MAG TPA: hypothetical protein VMS22_09600, partial [Candidatus Eisenbacteria bacterium]|nr:hypothetical protein [Candidatus Eisenbacteria bacterium]